MDYVTIPPLAQWSNKNKLVDIRNLNPDDMPTANVLSTVPYYTPTVTTKNNKDIAHISYWVTSATQQSDVTKNYTSFSITYSAADLGIANRIYNSFDEGDFEATVQTTGLKSVDKNDDFQIRVTQLYLTIDYEPLPSYLYIRQNNIWKQCTPYKKINSVWT